MAKILVADDEPKIRQIVCDFLKNFSYETVEAEDGDQAYSIFSENQNEISLVILDIMMPGLNGWEVCKKIREISRVPVIMLTARSEEFDEIMGYESGADDYITKPFSPTILCKKVELLLLRSKEMNLSLNDDNVLSINHEAHEVKLGKEEIFLTLKEYNILKTLLEGSDRVFSREQLLDIVWGVNYDGDIRTVDSHVARLRTKLGDWGNKHLKTVYGIGYKIEEAN